MEIYTLPSYDKLPDFPIFIDQVITIVENHLSSFFFDDEKIITKSMINNYVKNGLVRSPIKKKYERDQLVYIMIICLLKKSFNLDEIGMIINTVVDNVALDISYNYFCADLKCCLECIFAKKPIEHVPYYVADPELAYACQNVLLTVAHKIYLESILKNNTEVVK